MQAIRRWGVLCTGVGAVFLLKALILPDSIQSNILYHLCLFFLTVLMPVPARVGQRNIILTLSALFTLFFVLAALVAKIPDATRTHPDYAMAAILALYGAILIHPRFDLTPLEWRE